MTGISRRPYSIPLPSIFSVLPLTPLEILEPLPRVIPSFCNLGPFYKKAPPRKPRVLASKSARARKITTKEAHKNPPKKKEISDSLLKKNTKLWAISRPFAPAIGNLRRWLRKSLSWKCRAVLPPSSCCMMGLSLFPMKTSTRMLWSTSFFRHKSYRSC